MSTTTHIQALLLTVNSEVKSVKLTASTPSLGFQLSDVQKYLKKKVAPQILGTYPWKGNTIYLIGYKEGKAGTENKHELPPPLDSQLFFGDIIVLLSKEKRSFAKPLAFKLDEYEDFYTQMFEGFEDLDGEEGEGEGEEEEVEGEEEDLAQDDEVEDDLGEDVEVEEEGAEGEEDEVAAPVKDEDEELLTVQAVPPIQRKRQTKSEKASKSKKKEAANTCFHLEDKLSAEATIGPLPPTEKQRLQTLLALQNLFKTILSDSEALELEHHIYNASLHVADRKHITKNWAQPLFLEIYKSLSRTVSGNLSPTNYVKNESLYRRYKEGQVTLADIAHFNFSDLYPEIWKELSMRQYEKEKRQLEGNKSMATDQFQCKRCGKRECTYYELQTRSADEPMTIFIQCLNCGKHWRQ